MNEEEVKETAPETPQETRDPQPQPETPAPGKAELAALENAIYRKHLEALSSELAELRAKYDLKVDPADTLAEEVRELKGEFAELKSMLQNLPAQMQQQQQTAPPPPMPQQMQWQPPAPQPIGVPYIQTPNYTPLMPATTTLFR